MNRLQHLSINASGFTFNPRTGDSLRFNETGARIVAHMTAGRSSEDIARALAKEYDVSYHDALEDTLEFQMQLRLLGLSD